MKDPICPTCRRPKTASNRGSLTQWITACSCDLKAPDNQQASSLHFCRSCGKRIGEGRAGSFTQYIFRFDTCRCEFPEAVLQTFGQTSYQVFEEHEAELIDDEPVLETLPGPFPIDRYKPLAILGQGSSGLVYLGRDRLLKKRVAVKVLRGLNSVEVVAFQKEARATSKLKHDGIVKLLDFGLIDSSIPYMVLEYVSGLSLKETLAQNGTLQWQASVFIARQLCEALEYAHQQGIFHRDLQPSNIIITRDADSSSVKLIDFGIAKSIRDATGSMPPGNEDLVGTPFYMSPDQGFGRKYQATSEVYSLACVLFECLTGHPPFEGETALETLTLHANEIPPTLHDAYQSNHIDSEVENVDFLESLEVLVGKCLAKQQEDRYQSMAELQAALHAISADYGQSKEDAPLGSPGKGSAPLVFRKSMFPVIVIGCVCLVGLLTLFVPKLSDHPEPVNHRAMIVLSKSKLPSELEGKVFPRNSQKEEPKTRRTLVKNASWATDLEKGEQLEMPAADVPTLVHGASVATQHKNYKLAISFRRKLCARLKQDGTTIDLIAQTSNLASNLLYDRQSELADEQFQTVINYADELSKINKPLSKVEMATLVAPSWFFLSQSAQKRKDLDLSETRMEKAIEILQAGPDPSSKKYANLLCSAYTRLARMNFVNHQYDDAIANQKKCIEAWKKFGLPNVEGQQGLLEKFEQNRK